MVLSVSDSDIKVYNAALSLIGVRAIGAFTENSIAARTGNALYADTLSSVLADFPWRFATRRVEAVRLVDDPPQEWEGLYDIPSPLISARNVYENDTSIEFDRFEGNVAVNIPSTSTSTIYVEGAVVVGPAAWPGYFTQPFTTYLAGVVCNPITKDERRGEALMNQGFTMLRRAASRDSQSRTSPRLDTKTFIRARRGGRAI